MEDKKIICAQCNATFYLSSAEMERILSRGFGLPKRCSDCRKKKNKAGKPPDNYGKTKGKKKNHRRNRFEEHDYSY